MARFSKKLVLYLVLYLLSRFFNLLHGYFRTIIAESRFCRLKQITVDYYALLAEFRFRIVNHPAPRTMIFISHESQTRSTIHSARSDHLFCEFDHRPILLFCRCFLHYSEIFLSGSIIFSNPLGGMRVQWFITARRYV
jgi:hypothetical protein